MRNRIHITLFGALLLGTCVLLSCVTALPASAATFSSTTASHSTTVSKSLGVQTAAAPKTREEYNRGFRCQVTPSRDREGLVPDSKESEREAA
jgi:hypothetical protein